MTWNSTRLAAVEHAQHDDAIAVDPIPKYVSRPQYAQDDLPILLASGNRVSEPWLCFQQRRLGNDFRVPQWQRVPDSAREEMWRNDRGRRGQTPTIRSSLLTPGFESGRSPGFEPPCDLTVRHGRIACLDRRPAAIEFRNLIGLGGDRAVVERYELRHHFADAYTACGRARLKHSGRHFIDLDRTKLAHGRIIAGTGAAEKPRA
jgi:hypothetical protein